MNHLEDEFSLRLLRHLVSGDGVKVNINSLAKQVDIHRSTASSRVNALFDNRILDRPRYPFLHLFQEYPLLVIALADIPRTTQATEFFKEDSHIFAAYTCREGPYNTLLIEFFKDMESYHSWRETIVNEQKLPSRENRATAEVYIFSNKLGFKYDPSCFIQHLKNEMRNNKKIMLSGHKLDKKDFQIIELLMKGENVYPNDTYIAKENGTNRKKVQRRISTLISDRVIDEPKCYFPDLLTPPKYNLILTMFELKSKKPQVKKDLLKNNHIPRALESSIGRYNILTFSAFPTIDDFFEWADALANRYHDSIGAMSNIILSSKTPHTINPQKVSIGFIENKLQECKIKSK